MIRTRRNLPQIALALTFAACLLAAANEACAGDVLVVRGRGRSRWATPVTTTGYIRPRRVVPATIVTSALPLATSPVIRPLRRRWTVPALSTQPTFFVHPTASMYYPTTPLNLALVLDSH